MKYIFAIVLLCFVSVCFAQTDFIANTRRINQLIQLHDGSYTGVGGTSKYVVDPSNQLDITRFSASGQFISQASSGGLLSFTLGYAVTKTADSGFAVLGTNDNNILLIKYDSSAALQWEKSYPISFYNTFQQYNSITGIKLLQLNNKGYLIAFNVAGNILSADTTNMACLLQTDSTGAIQWAKQFFNYPFFQVSHSPDDNFIPAAAVFNDVAIANDGYICLASTSSLLPNATYTDTTWLIKVNKKGAVMWSKYIDNAANKIAHSMAASITLSPDSSSFIIAGATDKEYYSSPADSFSLHQLFITKTDTAGNVIWSKTNDSIPGDNFSLSSIKKTNDNSGYVCAGSMSSTTLIPDTAYYAGYVLKIDDNGNMQESKTLSIRTHSFLSTYSYYYALHFNDIISTADNGYCIAGKYISGNSQAYGTAFIYPVYKTNAALHTCNAQGYNSRNYGSLINLTERSIAATIPVADFKAVAKGADSIIFYDNSYYNVVCNDSSDVLPVQLLSFAATTQNNKVAIKWKTANEENTAYFTVQRGSTPASFANLQQVQASGNSTTVKHYNVTDNNPLTGTSYYRLRTADKDGKITYSSVVQVFITNNGKIIIAPNPVGSIVHVTLQSDIAGKLIMQITDLTGKLLATHQSMMIAGVNDVKMNAVALPKGYYILKIIQSNGAVQSIKFMKE